MDKLKDYLALRPVYKLGRHLEGGCQLRCRNDCAELDISLTAFFVCKDIYIFSHFLYRYPRRKKIKVRRIMQSTRRKG